MVVEGLDLLSHAIKCPHKTPSAVVPNSSVYMYIDVYIKTMIEKRATRCRSLSRVPVSKERREPCYLYSDLAGLAPFPGGREQSFTSSMRVEFGSASPRIKQADAPRGIWSGARFSSANDPSGKTKRTTGGGGCGQPWDWMAESLLVCTRMLLVGDEKGCR